VSKALPLYNANILSGLLLFKKKQEVNAVKTIVYIRKNAATYASQFSLVSFDQHEI
jgi:hypothetical protein